MSPISSRNSVPPLATSTLPMVCLWAPVKAPRSWPNNSLSSRFSGIAAQLMATKRCLLRPLRSCSARASSSLPVPLSPSSSTEMSVDATFSIVRHSFSIASSAAMMPAIGDRSGSIARRRFSRSSAAMRAARSTSSCSTSTSTGFW